MRALLALLLDKHVYRMSIDCDLDGLPVVELNLHEGSMPTNAIGRP